jgi:SAM-dependent methyltransferase
MAVFRNTLLDLVFAPWSIYTLFTANRLKIFTLLAEKEMTVDEIAALLSAQKGPLEGLLDACAAVGLLRRQGNLYQNSHMSDAYLVEGRPLYLGDIIEVQSIEMGNWERLYSLVISGDTSTGDRTRREVTPELFTMAMNNLGMLGEAEALANAVDLSGCKTMIDVGCGSGIYSIALCRHYPDLVATLLDTKEVLKTTSQLIRKNNLQDRVNIQTIDILKDAFGSHMDVALLSDVLYHDSSSCVQILRSAYDALAPGGMLIVRGYYADPEKSQPVYGSLFALGQLLFDENREVISIPVLHSWVKKVGFKIIASRALTERSTCVLANK